MTGEMTITKCGCGDRACCKYRLSGAGSEGMFEHAEATKIALRYNTQPDLLAALEGAAHELGRLMKVLLPHYEGKIAEPSGEVLGKARAAIAKATGSIPQCAHGIDEDDACDRCDAAMHSQP